MILLFDISGGAEQAAPALKVRGITPSEVLSKEALKPRRLWGTLRRLRKMHPEACYILCRQIGTQFNRFPLKVIAALAGAKRVYFCDEQATSPPLTTASILFCDLPLYLLHCAYALVSMTGACALYLLLRVVLLLRKRPQPPITPSHCLCYIKTDFWQGLKAGGSVTHTREFVNAGCDLGYRFEVFACDSLVHYRLRPEVQVIEPSAALYDLPVLFSQMEYNLRLPFIVWRKLRGRALDGIYQRHSSNNFSGVTLSFLLGVPFFLEHNSSSSWIATNWCGQRSSVLPGLCEALNFSGAYRVAVVSKVLKQGLLSAGLDAAKVVVNPNGVDPLRFGPDVDTSQVRGSLPAGKLLVGFIGVFGQWHGVLTLMRCVKLVVELCPEAQFVIIGDGALKQQMLEILRKDGVAKHVTFVGLVKHDLAPAYLNACDVLVSPHEDMADGSVFFGSPTKIFEYMATGKGIVASKVGQLSDLLDDGKDALLVEQRDERQLASAIIRLLRNSALRAELGGAARNKAISRYTWQENFQRALSLQTPRAVPNGFGDREREAIVA